MAALKGHDDGSSLTDGGGDTRVHWARHGIAFKV